MKSFVIGPHNGFGLYVHWPYCARICPYCDFNVYADKGRDDRILLAAILRDIERHRCQLPDHPVLDSIYFGGGTPSLLSSSALGTIIETARRQFGFSANIEINLEANPNDVLRADLAGWAGIGINRISVGVQSIDDAALTFLGRDHDNIIACRAIEAIQAVFSNYSLDFIYARPGQTGDDWRRELMRILAFGAPHLSFYQLTIADNTAFGRMARRGVVMSLPERKQADLYLLTGSLCDAAGLPAYEISNHARTKAFEAQHNHVYWASGDWIGVGPGAHGRLTINGQRHATETARRPADYVRAENSPTKTLLNTRECADEYLCMALRRVRGLDLKRYQALFARLPPAGVVQDLQGDGLIEQAASRLWLTRRGWLLADHVAALLAA